MKKMKAKTRSERKPRRARFYSNREVLEILGIEKHGRATLCRLRDYEGMPHTMLGPKTIIYPVDLFEEWLEARTHRGIAGAAL